MTLSEEDISFILQKLKKWEGGYVNHPKDKGGETVFGITRKYYPHLKIWSAIDELKRTESDKKRLINKINKLDIVYKNEILDVQRKYFKIIDSLPSSLNIDIACGMVLFSFNTGKQRIRIPEQCSDVAAYCKEFVLNHYRKIIDNDPTQEIFRKGWQNRVQDSFNDKNLKI